MEQELNSVQKVCWVEEEKATKGKNRNNCQWVQKKIEGLSVTSSVWCSDS